MAGLSPSVAQAGLLDPIATCTLTLSTSGIMTMTPAGTTMGTQNAGGLSASMLLVGVNLVPELLFSAPATVGPSGWSASPTTMISVDTLSGTRTGYSSSGFSVRPGVLLDTLTINAKIDSPTGFKSGNYSVNTTITCQSAA